MIPVVVGVVVITNIKKNAFQWDAYRPLIDCMS